MNTSESWPHSRMINEDRKGRNRMKLTRRQIELAAALAKMKGHLWGTTDPNIIDQYAKAGTAAGIRKIAKKRHPEMATSKCRLEPKTKNGNIEHWVFENSGIGWGFSQDGSGRFYYCDEFSNGWVISFDHKQSASVFDGYRRQIDAQKEITVAAYNMLLRSLDALAPLVDSDFGQIRSILCSRVVSRQPGLKNEITKLLDVIRKVAEEEAAPLNAEVLRRAAELRATSANAKV
jgi:hypothetical protein